MGKLSRHNASRYTDPIIIFYAVLGFKSEELPDSFPKENKAAFFLLFGDLTERERNCVIAHYGLDGQPRKTMARLASEMNQPLSSSRIGQIIARGMRRLRNPTNRHKFETLLYPRAHYSDMVTQARKNQIEAEQEICHDPRTVEFLEHITKAASILEELEKSDAAKRLREERQIIDDCSQKIATIIQPREDIGGIANNIPLNVLEDTRRYVVQLTKLSGWIKDGNIILDEYDDSLKASLKDLPILEEDRIEYLDLSIRSYNSLVRGGIKTISDLSTKSKADLMRIRNMGRKSIDEIVQKCAKMGIILSEK